MEMIEGKLNVAGEALAYTVCQSGRQESEHWVVLLHGAGKSASQEALKPIAAFLAGQGIDSLLFDFSGHGKSTTANRSSIAQRTREAAGIVAAFRGQHRFIHLFAFSMSGQVALNLTTQFDDIRSLNLFSPALYDVDAFDIEFGERFTRKISAHESWRNHNAVLLHTFSGRVTLVRSDCDEVIPQEVFALYQEHAVSEHFTEVVLPGAPHTLGKWISESPDRFPGIFHALALVFAE